MLIYHEKSSCITLSPELTVRSLAARLRPLGYILGYSPSDGDNVSIAACLLGRRPNRYFLRYGDIGELCIGWKMRLPNGNVWEIKPYPRAATGPDLRRFLTGATAWDGMELLECTLKIFPIPEEDVVLAYRFAEMPDVNALIYWMLNHFIRPDAVWAGPLSQVPLKIKADKAGNGDSRATDSLVVIGLSGKQTLVHAQLAVIHDYLTLRKGNLVDITSADLTLLCKILHGQHPLGSQVLTSLVPHIPGELSQAATRKNLAWLDAQWKRVEHRLPGAEPL